MNYLYNCINSKELFACCAPRVRCVGWPDVSSLNSSIGCGTRGVSAAELLSIRGPEAHGNGFLPTLVARGKEVPPRWITWTLDAKNHTNFFSYAILCL